MDIQNMKDSLILEGKIYISARRAARIINYAQDYVGQLCRAGKLDCRMVGRSWFVTEESLLSHRQSALDATTEKVSKIIEQPDIKNESKIAIPFPVKAVEPVASNFKYEPIKSALLPEVRKKVPVYFSLPKGTVMTNPVVARVSPIHDSKIILTLALLLFSGFVFSVSLSSMNSGNISTFTSSISSASRDMAHRVATFFDQSNDINLAQVGTGSGAPTSSATPAISKNLANQETQNLNGLGIVSSSQSELTDTQQKEKIRNSFSDQVAIHPDQSGTAGIITPVFRKTNGDDFVYVLVPVKDKNQDKNQDKGQIKNAKQK